MADYPATYYNPRAKENWPDVVFDSNKKAIIFKEDFDSLENEIKAIEQELGLYLKGSYSNLKERIEAIEDRAEFRFGSNYFGQKYFDVLVGGSAVSKDVVKLTSGEGASIGWIVNVWIFATNWSTAVGEVRSCLLHRKVANGDWTSGGSHQNQINVIGAPAVPSFAWNSIDGLNQKLTITVKQTFSRAFILVRITQRNSAGSGSFTFY